MTKNHRKKLTSNSVQIKNAIKRKKEGHRKRVAGQKRFDEDFLNESNTTDKR